MKDHAKASPKNNVSASSFGRRIQHLELTHGFGRFALVTPLRDCVKSLERGAERVRELFHLNFSADTVLAVTKEIRDLATAYVAQGVVSQKFQDDARHVAACTVHGIGLLVSWNFKHLVNVRREAGFNGVNLLKGYPAIRIVNPLELIYEPEDQSL